MANDNVANWKVASISDTGIISAKSIIGIAGEITVGNVASPNIVDILGSEVALLTDVLYVGNLPTSDPAQEGQVWSNAGVLTVSAG